MPRRIDIELTSSRDDGSWTWRVAGAKAPKGSVPGGLLPTGSKIGDVLRVDAEFFVDGIAIVGVLPAKESRQQPELLELISVAKDEPLVTSTLTSRQSDDRRPRRDGPRREGGPRRDAGPRREGDRGPRPPKSDQSPPREKRERPPRRTRPEPPPMPVVERPKAKRLKAGKAHRTALLESLPEEQRPIAEQVVLGGLPAVRQAIEKQNAERTAAGEPAIASGPLLALAETLVPKVRTAEWHDRAEAAQRDLEVIDLRDLRSVVSTADAAGRDDESRALAQSLKEGLATRVDAEHAAWLAELVATLDVGRIVRALRLSSRPPKAGSPLPPEIATRLIEGAGAALTADAAAERWVAVLDALAFAPVRDKVIPASLPKELHPDVRATIARLATRIPKIAHIFEITPDRNAPRPKTERRRPKKPAPKPPRPAELAAAPEAEAPPEPAAATEATTTSPTEAPDAVEATPAAEAPAETEAPEAPDASPAPEASPAPVEVEAAPETAAAPEAESAPEEPEATGAPSEVPSTPEG